jgi:uroporphyrinogen-III synthase
MSFAGLRVLSLESRRAEDMHKLIVRYGGNALVAPSVSERPLQLNDEIRSWMQRLLQGDFDLFIAMTGVGLTYLRDALATEYDVEDFAVALRRITVVSRGSKPIPLLREMKVPVAMQIPEPNTWREVLGALRERPEQRITIQEYGTSSTELEKELRSLGRQVSSVSIYRWELPEDQAPLEDAVVRIAECSCDVVLFTTSVQLTHLLLVAGRMGREADVLRSLQRDIAIVSIGPIATAALEEKGIRPEIVPLHPKMGAMVRTASEQAHAVLAMKRATA